MNKITPQEVKTILQDQVVGDILKLAFATQTTPRDIIENLTELCWDEEEASRLTELCYANYQPRFHEKQGNLLDALDSHLVQAIGHCCNCYNKMGAGIAKQIATRYPAVLEADKNYRPEFLPIVKLGGCSYIPVNPEQDIVFNLYGQLGYGTDKRHLDYSAIEDALSGMREAIEYINKRRESKRFQDGPAPIRSIGFPKYMGCGLAGGDWDKVFKIIQKVFKYSNLDVYIVDFNK